MKTESSSSSTPAPRTNERVQRWKERQCPNITRLRPALAKHKASDLRVYVNICPKCGEKFPVKKSSRALIAGLRAILKPSSSADYKEKVKAGELLAIIEGFKIREYLSSKPSIITAGDPLRQPLFKPEDAVEDELEELFRKTSEEEQ
jgi:hypothetical protein